MIALHRAYSVFLAAFVLPPLLACPLLAQEPVQAAPDAELTRALIPMRAPDPGLAEGEDIDAILGGSLEVGGRTITPEEIKRTIVTGAPGRAILEAAKLQIFIEEEIQRQIDAGKDVSVFQVTDEDVQAALDEVNEAIKREYPDGEIKSIRDLLPMPARKSSTGWVRTCRSSSSTGSSCPRTPTSTARRPSPRSRLRTLPCWKAYGRPGRRSRAATPCPRDSRAPRACSTPSCARPSSRR